MEASLAAPGLGIPKNGWRAEETRGVYALGGKGAFYVFPLLSGG